MPTPRVILLDLDGTLVDATDAIVEGVRELAAEAGLEVPDERWARGRIGHAPETTWELLGADDPAAMVDAFTLRVLPGLAARTRVLPGVTRTLEVLAAHGLVMAVATTRLTDSAWQALDATGLAGWVSHVSGRDRVDQAKPAPDVLLHALEAVDGAPGDALMIGDSVADVLASHAASVRCWAVLGGSDDEKALREAGAELILSGGLGDVPRTLGIEERTREERP